MGLRVVYQRFLVTQLVLAQLNKLNLTAANPF